MMRIFIRNEHFGAIVYNPQLAEYFHLSHKQASAVIDAIEQKTLTHENQALLKRVLGSEDVSGSHLVRIGNKSILPARLSAPLKVFFNITKKCNLFCRHCYNDSGRTDSPELPYVDVEKTFGELEQRGIFKVTIAGGEPLFHPDFDKILKAWDNTALSISLITNGICVSARRAEQLGKSTNLRSITVSLDGANAKDNDLVRGKGSFDRALRGIVLLKKYYSGPLAVRITLMRSNIAQVKELPELLAKIGVTEIKVNPINAYGRAKEESNLLLLPDEYLTARNDLLESATKYGISLEVPAHQYQRDENDQVGLCKSGEETFEIEGDGSVYPCSFSFGRFFAGNIRTHSFDEIFQNLQQHTINNPWCFDCKGRGGKAEKVFGNTPRLLQLVLAS